MSSRLSVEGTPATKVRSTASTASAFNYPHGHVGYLSPQQEEALTAFKNVLEERGIWKRGPPPSHNDQTLLRYLRARRWIVEDAYVQFKESEDWRAANSLDELYRTIDRDAYEESRRVYPQWTGRRDRRGIPLYVFEIRHLDSKTISAYEKSPHNAKLKGLKTDGHTSISLLKLFALYENLTNFAHPFCTQLTDRESADVPVTMSTNIVDVSGVGLKQFWNLKGHMQAASQLATAHYPETLDRIFIIGAPMFFSTVWGWIKRWFDPITVSKIFILGSHEVKPVLESFIDPKNIPKKYGGELDFTWGQLPVNDPSWDGVVEWDNGYTSFPSGPLLWEDVDGEDKIACYSMGSTDGQPQHVKVCTVPRTWHQPAAETPAEAVTTTTTTNGTADAAVETGEQTPMTSEATQTADEQDEATQTGDDLTVEKLKINDTTTETTTPTAAAVVA